MSDPNPAKPESRPDPAISRRDFLRRTGKEAAYTGTKLVPGAAIAQKVLGIPATNDPAQDAQDAKSARSTLAERIAAWRKKRRESDSTPQ